ncbi:MAG TPA: ABC transporter substrate-binding protein [Stellaceae bacterium]|nr:ABC transporter substrate-binding protein [Stellaceae bacterium]
MMAGRVGAAIMALLLCASPVAAKTLRWSSDQDVFSLDPYARQETFLLSFDSNIYEPLVRRGRDLRLEPALAVSWQQAAPNRWRFALRHGVRFQDGAPFTAADVVFSFARARAPTSEIAHALAAIRSVDRIDDFTVDITTHEPDPILPEELPIWDIMSAQWCAKHDAEQPANALTGAESYASNHADGTGPFKLDRRKPEVLTVLSANPAWWDTPQHNLDRVEFRPMTGAKSVAALLAGKLDMLYAVPPQSTDRIARSRGVHLVQGPGLRTIFLGFDLRDKQLGGSDVKGRNPFRDRRVRQAFYQAIDEGTIRTKVMRGFATPTALLVGPGVNGFDPALNQRLPFDPGAAKALLAEAGYPRGFSVGMDCPNDRYLNDEAICDSVVAMAAKIGVKLHLDAQTRGKFFAKLMAPGQGSSFFLMGWAPPTYDALDAVLNLAATPNKAAHRGGANFGGYSNPALDALIAQVETEADAKKRLDLLHQALALVKRDIAYIPLHQQDLVWAARDNVALVQQGDGYFPLRDVQIK